MGNSHSSLQHETVNIQIRLLHNDGEMNITAPGSITINDIKRRLNRHHNFQYTTRIGETDDKWIINGQVVLNHFTMNDCLKRNSIRSLNIILLHKVRGNWVRYKCINCGYIGSVEYHHSHKIASIMSCSKCHYPFPSPQYLMNTPSKYTLQQLLQETNYILPTLLSQLKQLNVATNIIQCIISFCVGDIQRITENGEIKLCNTNIYYYSLIYNPFKPYKYEWIPTTIYKYDCDNEEIILSNPDIGEIHTNYLHKYDTSESMKSNCLFDDNKRFAIFESEKECKVWIGSEQIYFDEEIYCNEKSCLTEKKDEVEFEVKTLTGRTLIVNLGINEPVLSLKQFVLDNLGIPFEQQRWISPYGRSMEDHKTLKYYGVSYGAPLRLVLRLRG